jgi:hypothetical protein
MRVAFFHGLGSQVISEKTYALREKFDDVYDPPMDYTDPLLFEKVLKHLQENPVDLLIGSSMGGYFAYCLSTIIGTRTLLFNPAVHSRSLDPVVEMGGKESNHLIVLGNSDNVITPKETEQFFKGISGVNIIRENIEHRIPIEVFKKYIRLY